MRDTSVTTLSSKQIKKKSVYRSLAADSAIGNVVVENPSRPAY